MRVLPGSLLFFSAFVLIAFQAHAQSGGEGTDEAARVEVISDAPSTTPPPVASPAEVVRPMKFRGIPGYNGYGPHPGGRWRPRPPPRRPEDARDPFVAKAMREAPLTPDRPDRYFGRNDAMKAARSIAKRIPLFFNFRATIALSKWRVNPYYVWRIRPTHKCLAELRQQKIRFRPYRADPPEDPEEEPPPPYPTPTPVYVKGPIDGVRFTSGHNASVLISCELATRLPAFAEILNRHGVDHAVVVSAYRPTPRSSFHTFGMALDIARFHLREPLRGPRGRESEWLSVLHDFLEDREAETCDPANFGPDSPLGDNERGRRLLAIACELYETGVFSTVLTPNYNPGHRDHYHVDVRPDDPRVFMR